MAVSSFCAFVRGAVTVVLQALALFVIFSCFPAVSATEAVHVNVEASLENLGRSSSIAHPEKEGGGLRHHRNLVEENENATNTTAPTVSPYFQWDTSMWAQRNIQANVSLDLQAFEKALLEASENQCNMGITATVYDATATQILQTTVGSNYHDLAARANESVPWVSGWTGDTVFALYSNSKIFAATLYMAAVVDTGLGYLDEPLFVAFDEYLSPSNKTGRITPRMILSHQTGIKSYNRNQPTTDPLYSCIGNANTTLGECVQAYLLNDEVLVNDPGTVVSYSNDPFYILADLLVRKTGFEDIQQLVDVYINEPLGINVTYDCPLVGSTPDKPHVSWGICATGHDVSKLIQELMHVQASIGANDESSNCTNTTTTSYVISATSVKQILSFHGMIAANADEPLGFNMPLSNCLSRLDKDINFIIGYGLGTMITPGIKGILFVHAATVGGYWVIAPGKYAAYFAFMKQGAFPSAYAWVARVIDRFERASSIRVRNAWDAEGENANEITPCVDGMFLETSVLDDASVPWTNCPVPT